MGAWCGEKGRRAVRDTYDMICLLIVYVSASCGQACFAESGKAGCGVNRASTNRHKPKSCFCHKKIAQRPAALSVLELQDGGQFLQEHTHSDVADHIDGNAMAMFCNLPHILVTGKIKISGQKPGKDS